MTQHDQQALEMFFAPELCHKLTDQSLEVSVGQIFHRRELADQCTQRASGNTFQRVNLLPVAVFRLEKTALVHVIIE